MSIISKVCLVENCKKPYKGSGYCSTHWARMKKHGTTNYMGKRQYHGMNRSPEHVAWKAMKQRCYDPNFKQYKDYGGRGIKVADEWLHNFAAFYEHVGTKPTPKHSLDRINTNEDYKPGNVKWSTPIEQGNNTRRNRLVEHKGETYTLAEWSRITGIKYSVLADRINKCGWSIEKSLTTPIKVKGQVAE